MVRYRYIQRRIPIEKAIRLKREANRFYRHYRPILGPDNVVGCEGVPDNDIARLQRAVLLYVDRKPITTRLLIWIVPSRVAF